MIGGCTVDVNSLAQSSAQSVSSGSDTDSHTDVFYKNDDTDSDTQTDIQTDTQTDTDTASDPAAFDESKYLTMFVSGSAKVSLTADALENSKEVAGLKSGERVSVVRRDVQGYYFVYSPEHEQFGYIRPEYLADYLEEATVGDVYYIKPAQTQVYSDPQLTELLETAKQNDMFTVLVMRVDGHWRVQDKDLSVGYIDKGLLSKSKVTSESVNTSSKNTSSKAESKTESKAEKKTVSKAERAAASSSAPSEEAVSGLYTGKADAPEEYTTYIVDVDVGYLSLRSAPSKSAKEIGELYYEERVFVVDTSGDYWYIYAPSLGMYGYVTGDPNYLYPAE